MRRPQTVDQQRAISVGLVMLLAAVVCFISGLAPVWPLLLGLWDANGSGSIGLQEALAGAWPLLVGVLLYCFGNVMLTLGLYRREYTLEELVAIEEARLRARERRLPHETRIEALTPRASLFDDLQSNPPCVKCGGLAHDGPCDEALSG